MTLNQLRDEVHELAVQKGWWPDGEPLGIPEKLALVHSEVSEALEEYRTGETTLTGFRSRNEDGKPEGFAVEVADTIIRLLDLCGALGIDVERHVQMKHEFNKTRPHRHGGKRC